MRKIIKNENVKFIILLMGMIVILFVKYFDDKVVIINSTMFAFSYKYGFISRGLIGTIYSIINHFSQSNLVNYYSMKDFIFISTWILYAIMLIMIIVVIKRCHQTIRKQCEFITVFLFIHTVPMFACQYNFGRLDLYCLAVSLVAVILLIVGKFEWLVVPLSAIGTMFHQGYVFMFFNVILVILLYKYFSADQKKEKIKYGAIFICSFLVASGLFLWFECFSHFNGDNIYSEIIRTASAFGEAGGVHTEVVDHEILGIDLTNVEIIWRKHNILQFPFYVLLMLPYIIIVTKFFVGLIKKAELNKDKIKYFIAAIGVGTMIPEFLLKVDYGRWMFAVIAYYCVVILFLIAMGDAAVECQLIELVAWIRQKGPIIYLLLFIPVLLQPLCDVNICPLTEKIGTYINENLLNYWYIDP